MLKITIPTPCHEDWAKMTETQQGRHCNACAKTVVDFTTLTDDEVKQFLIGRTAEKVCGRFTAAQLQRVRINVPNNIFYMPMPLWKRFLVASLLIFGSTLFSCDAGIEPPAVGRVQPLSPVQSIAANTLFPKQCYVGMLAISDTTPVPAVNTYYPPPPVDIKGDIAMVPDTVITVSPPPQQGFTTGEIAMPVAVSDTANCNNKKYY